MCIQEAERAEKAIKDAVAHLKEVVREREPPPPNLDFQVCTGRTHTHTHTDTYTRTHTGLKSVCCDPTSTLDGRSMLLSYVQTRGQDYARACVYMCVCVCACACVCVHRSLLKRRSYSSRTLISCSLCIKSWRSQTCSIYRTHRYALNDTHTRTCM